MAMSWRWPCEKFVPPAETFVSKVTEVLDSTSVLVTERESTVSSRSTLCTDGALEAFRDDEALCGWDDSGVSVIMCTRRRTSIQSASVCSSGKDQCELCSI